MLTDVDCCLSFSKLTLKNYLHEFKRTMFWHYSMYTIITLLFALFLERVQIHSHGLLNLRLLDEGAKIADVLSLPVSQLVDRWLSHQHLGDVPRLLGDLGQLQGLLGGGSQHSSVIVVNLVHQTDCQGLLGGE